MAYINLDLYTSIMSTGRLPSTSPTS